MKDKKILFIYYRLFKAGGLTKVLINLVNELVNEGYDITILIMIDNHKSFYKLDNRVKIISINTFDTFEFKTLCNGINKNFPNLKFRKNINNYIYDFGQWRLLYSWLKHHHRDYDTVVSTYYKLSAQLSLNKRVNKKTIAWEHNSFYHGGLLWFKFLRKYYKNLKGIVCINIPGYNNYKLINNNTSLVRNIIGDSYEKLVLKNFEEKKDQIILVGRLDNQKNITEFLEILSNVDLKGWKVKIIGTGPQEGLLINKLNTLNLNDNVELVGQKTEREVIQYQLNSKIMCLTSLNEGLPTVLLESLFTSNPIISYDCNYGPSDIINQNNGFLIKMHNKKDFQDKLQFLIDNQNELERLSITSFEESKKWNKDNIIDRWKGLLQ